MSDVLQPDHDPKSSVLERIDELSGPPTVGQFYRVPTVLGDWNGRVDAWPVMGPKHEDAELRFPWRHYHVDVRFVSLVQVDVMRRVYRSQALSEGRFLDPLAFAAAAHPLSDMNGCVLPDPEERVLRCRSAGHAYPLDVTLKRDTFIKLHGIYAGRPCGRNASGQMICPHKGFALGSLVPDAAGRVTCPLHGLVIDVVTGAVVPPIVEAIRP